MTVRKRFASLQRQGGLGNGAFPSPLAKRKVSEATLVITPALSFSCGPIASRVEMWRGCLGLAKLRHNGGSTSNIEVLTNDTNYYSAQLTLAVAQENEALSIVQLYSALGGGWQE